ncbi:MAG: Hsp20/alpha crystallin family protein [Sandaracinaceae bacterium]
MDRVFDEMDRAWTPGRTQTPEVTLHDEGDHLTARIDVPGFQESDLEVSMDRNTLTVRGERIVTVAPGFSVHRQERGAMSFARTLTFPCRIDAEGVQATLRAGVLELTLPKAPEEQPRVIPVTIN